MNKNRRQEVSNHEVLSIPYSEVEHFVNTTDPSGVGYCDYEKYKQNLAFKIGSSIAIVHIPWSFDEGPSKARVVALYDVCNKIYRNKLDEGVDISDKFLNTQEAVEEFKNDPKTRFFNE